MLWFADPQGNGGVGEVGKGTKRPGRGRTLGSKDKKPRKKKDQTRPQAPEKKTDAGSKRPRTTKAKTQVITKTESDSESGSNQSDIDDQPRCVSSGLFQCYKMHVSLCILQQGQFRVILLFH